EPYFCFGKLVSVPSALQNQVTVANNGVNRTLTYDLDGAMTNNGASQTYGYDAENRLISVTNSSGTVQFAYDGLGHRIQQKDANGNITKQWVWCPGDAQPCEERDASNNVTKRFYDQGEQIGGTNYYFTRDHLGSVREMTNSAGSLVARYDYDPFGRRALVSCTDLADFGFQGMYYHQPSGLSFTLTRAYDPNLDRWLTRDTIGEAGGINVYQFVENDPVNNIDPLGLVTGKISGYVIQVHKNDVDPWPSSPHGHIYDKNLVVDTEGTLYNKTTGKIVDSIGRKALPKLNELFDKVRGAGGAGEALSVFGVLLDWEAYKKQYNERLNGPDGRWIDVPYDENGCPLAKGHFRKVWVPKRDETGQLNA
ncbi:MAG TPA: RHS repeat-associated core domain-containing protein, partial [Opitutaceae bacterium]|nr:RHS repeat-associated core domain-containing protein [Opitutaceae bacterium]